MIPLIGKLQQWIINTSIVHTEFLKIRDVNNTMVVGEFFAIALVTAILFAVAFPKQFLVAGCSPPPLTLDPM